MPHNFKLLRRRKPPRAPNKNKIKIRNQEYCPRQHAKKSTGRMNTAFSRFIICSRHFFCLIISLSLSAQTHFSICVVQTVRVFCLCFDCPRLRGLLHALIHCVLLFVECPHCRTNRTCSVLWFSHSCSVSSIYRSLRDILFRVLHYHEFFLFFSPSSAHWRDVFQHGTSLSTPRHNAV
jgi:hypothetical protein